MELISYKPRRYLEARAVSPVKIRAFPVSLYIINR